MTRRHAIITVIVVALLALLAWKLHTSHFDWADFFHAFRAVNWVYLLIAALIIWSNTIFRALRWAVFLKPSLPPGRHIQWWTLIGSQFIGFAGLAAFGRIAELIRPYLVSKRTGLPFSSQVGVVAVERIFDLGAFALIFAGNLVLAPQLNSLPFHERFHQVGYAIAGLTLFLCAFVFAVRIAGEATAKLFGGVTGKFSRTAGSAVAAKILEFRSGLNTIANAGDFALATLYSLILWITIAVAYVVVMRAFPPPVHDLTIAHTILLMGFSVVGSLVALPGVGGGAQALTIGALTTLFRIPAELAASAGLLLWFINTMSIILPGLICARFEQVSLSGIAHASEAAAGTPPEAK
jgi:glycosyltransferase 2 family protein